MPNGNTYDPYAVPPNNLGMNTGGGNAPMSDLIAAFGSGGNPLTSAGIQFGGRALEGLAGLVGGPTWGEGKAKEVFGLAQNRLGQSVIDPDQYYADYLRSVAPMVNKQGEQISQRTGLDSGVAQGALWDAQVSPISKYMFEFGAMADRLQSQSDNALLSLMGSLTAGR